MLEENKNTDSQSHRKPLSIYDEEISKALDELVEVFKKSKQSPVPEKTILQFPEAFEDIFSGSSTPNDNIYDDEKWNVCIQLLDHYFSSGVYKFSTILEDIYTRFGKEIQPYFKTIKVIYGIRYLEASNDVAEKMDENIRGCTYEVLAMEIESFRSNGSGKRHKQVTTLKQNQPSISRYSIAYYWIDYIRNYEKSYYLDLKQNGTLRQRALEKEEEYHKHVKEFKASGKYPPSGAEEVARMFLYPKLYP